MFLSQLELAAARDGADEAATAQQALEARLRDADSALKVPSKLHQYQCAGTEVCWLSTNTPAL